MRILKKLCLMAVLILGVLCGCMEREMTITSEPSGALVYISDQEVGRTPLTTSFTWYADYDIIARQDGYDTLKTHAWLTAPWYAVPPIDLLSEIAPWTYHDRRYVHLKMNKLPALSDAELLKHAEALRQKNAQPPK